MAHATKTANLGSGAGITIDLGATFSYIEVHAIGGAMQYRLSNGASTPTDPAAALMAGAPAVSDCGRLAAGGSKTHGVNYSRGTDLQVQDPAARYIEVWAEAAGSFTAVAH